MFFSSVICYQKRGSVFRLRTPLGLKFEVTLIIWDSGPGGVVVTQRCCCVAPGPYLSLPFGSRTCSLKRLNYPRAHELHSCVIRFDIILKQTYWAMKNSAEAR